MNIKPGIIIFRMIDKKIDFLFSAFMLSAKDFLLFPSFSYLSFEDLRFL
jgi:hypothetical protein